MLVWLVCIFDDNYLVGSVAVVGRREDKSPSKRENLYSLFRLCPLLSFFLGLASIFSFTWVILLFQMRMLLLPVPTDDASVAPYIKYTHLNSYKGMLSAI